MIRWGCIERITVWLLVLYVLWMVTVLDAMTMFLFDIQTDTRDQIDTILRLLKRYQF